ncbi:hypothetical protein GCM10011309_15740 [Litorimonas cladophorae]|uniref:HTH cro/C1-type domain-containing protein n=1 Tax=Litorimonas cladophorae TaxID=1220491 RepID=A0A918NEK8_9PROT|nr:helix-turn-helix transcriptional regulator [Litorimonas cladophorae]GGX66967.1 hypothetical protein GCM10011309_15740 [Litorimonas cladophorae]
MDIDTEKLKRWREERFWSQEHLADLSGIALRTVQRIENGGNASRESITALAAAYNVDAAALTFAPEDIAAEAAKQKIEKSKSALHLSFFIVAASWAFVLIVFAGISLSDGPGGDNMTVPAIWMTVGMAGHGLAVVIVELVARFGAAREG